jgi:pyrroloquinoline quinone (PQQ) biosynthesis protein C
MNFYDHLVTSTQTEQQKLFSAPIIQRCFQGDFVLDDYLSFLLQAFHHVKHTVPLLMNTGAKLSEEKEWLRAAIGEYIEEEMGHQEWILNDIAMCGYDKEIVRLLSPLPATEVMVSYAYDMINRVNPLGFFGMVHVLEGTSINIADKAADIIRDKLGLPRKAFSYLYSHGALDQDHVKFFKDLMNKITDENEQNLIIHSTKMFYKLYGDIFRNLNPHHHIPKMLLTEASNAAV